MSRTKIPWASDSINPLRTVDGGYHCTKVSAGCDHCWAESMNRRFGNGRPYDATPTEFVLDEEPFLKLARARKPKRVFLCSMCDVAHPDVSFEMFDEVLHCVAALTKHTFLLLTKRPERLGYLIGGSTVTGVWPIPNLWLYASVEDQTTLDERARYLLQIPAVVHGISYEPALGPIDARPYFVPQRIKDGYAEVLRRFPPSGPIPRHLQLRVGLDHVLVGGETGPGARPAHPDWFRKVRDDCKQAGVAFFLKHLGEWQFEHEFPTREGEEAAHHAAFFGKRREQMPHTYRRVGEGLPCAYRIGKKLAGRLLDGVEHSEFPDLTLRT